MSATDTDRREKEASRIFLELADCVRQ